MSGLSGGLPGVAVTTLATITVGTTAVQATSTAGQLVASVYIEADSGNTGTIYVGDSNVSTTRYMGALTVVGSGTAQGTNIKGMWITAPMPERAGASSLQLGSIYFVASAASQKVHVTYLDRMGG